jgi:outer membrane protein assembly factor BamB
MPRQRFTRRGWLAALAGVTAGCSARPGDDGATATRTETGTATPPPTANSPAARTVGSADGPDPEPAASFEQGPGNCALDPDAIPEGTWPMTHHDPAGTNAAPASNGPTGFPLNERWTMSALEAQVTFPVADDDYVYLVAADADSAASVPKSAVLCHDPRVNGEIRWRHRVDAMPVGPPVVAGDIVYVPFGTESDAYVVAVRRDDGSVLTRYDLPGQFVGELATAGTSLVIPTQGAYRVVDARTGEYCWSFAPNDVASSTRHDRHIRAAAVGDGVAYVGTGYPDGAPTTDIGHLYAVDPDIADMRWHVPLDGPVGRVAVADGVVLVAMANGVAGLDPENGEELWRQPVETRVRPATLVVTDDVVAFGTRRTLYGVDRTSGEERWTVEFGVRGDVIAVGDVLFAVGRADPTSQRILLAALDAPSGTLRWRQQIYDPIVDVMAAGGYLYSTTTDGRLFAFTSI